MPAPQVRPLGRTGPIEVFHEIRGILRRLRMRIDGQIQFRAYFPAKRPGFRNAERRRLWYTGHPEQLAAGTLRDRSHQFLPVEIGRGTTAGIPHMRGAQFTDGLHHVRTQAIRACQRG